MSRAQPWTQTVREGEARFDLAPPGFVAFYRLALATTLMIVAMALPMALIGVFGGLFWEDFGLPLRLAMAGFGGAVAAVLLWLPIKLVLGATSLRSRVRVLPHGVFVELGHTAPARTLWLAPRSDVKVDRGGHDELARRGVVLSCGAQKLRVGVGFDDASTYGLLTAMEAALRSIPAGPGPGAPPPTEPLGPPWGVRLRALADDLLRPLRRPTSFLLLDLGAIVGLLLFEWVLADLVDRGAAYPAAFALFLLGLAARRFDGSYLGGLRRLLADEPLWGFYYTLAGVVLGLAGVVGVYRVLPPGLWMLLPAVLAIALHALVLRRARGAAEPPRAHRALDLALAATLIPISVLHEAAMFEFLADGAEDLGPLTLCFVPPLVLFAYLPVRIHAFVDAPDDRSNVAWFWLTAGLLALQPFLSLGPALAREL